MSIRKTSPGRSTCEAAIKELRKEHEAIRKELRHATEMEWADNFPQ
jgi:hypothetical protein